MSSADEQRSPIRVGLIGAGQRAASYFRAIPAQLRERVRLVAIADPEAHQREAFAQLFGASPAFYDDGVELIRAEQLDAVIVASPNARHVPYAVEAMSRSLPLMLEKPVATTIDGLQELWRAEQERAASRTVVGFVLRYTPFYSRVREILASGRLGEILSVEADENLGTALTLVQHLGWRHDVAVSGGWMAEKCCHDLDVLGYLLGSRPARVFSMASARHFRPRPEAEQLDRFSAEPGRADLDFGDEAAKEALRDAAQHSPYSPSGLPDRQVAVIEFRNGVLATFNATMAQPRTNRRLRIMGTEGLLEGDIASSRLTLQFPDPSGSAEVTEETIEIPTGTSGHHGGDEVLGDTFWNLAAGDDREPRATLEDGIDAVLCALALQDSARTGQQVDIEELRAQVFGEGRG